MISSAPDRVNSGSFFFSIGYLSMSLFLGHMPSSIHLRAKGFKARYSGIKGLELGEAGEDPDGVEVDFPEGFLPSGFGCSDVAPSSNELQQQSLCSFLEVDESTGSDEFSKRDGRDFDFQNSLQYLGGIASILQLPTSILTG
jgi:hypothetical protein